MKNTIYSKPVFTTSRNVAQKIFVIIPLKHVKKCENTFPENLAFCKRNVFFSGYFFRKVLIITYNFVENTKSIREFLFNIQNFIHLYTHFLWPALNMVKRLAWKTNDAELFFLYWEYMDKIPSKLKKKLKNHEKM